MVLTRLGHQAVAALGRPWDRAIVLGVLAALGLSVSCGGQSRSVHGDGSSEAGAGAGTTPAGGSPSAGYGGTSGVAGTAGLGGNGGRAMTGGSGGSLSTGGIVEPPDPDPGCPDEPAPPGTMECDLFGTPSGCGPGDGCYPTLEHPHGMGCDQQVHGSRCAPAGARVQGEFCPGGSFECASGFICIIGAEAGSRCMRMCTVDGAHPCPPGFFCGETDARGVGVCA